MEFRRGLFRSTVAIGIKDVSALTANQNLRRIGGILVVAARIGMGATGDGFKQAFLIHVISGFLQIEQVVPGRAVPAARPSRLSVYWETRLGSEPLPQQRNLAFQRYTVPLD